jgi:hypothetical protein
MINKKFITYSLVALVIFLGLVYYNYQVAQKNFHQTSPSRFDIQIVSAPTETKVNDHNQVVWEVTADSTFSTTSTTIYWSEHSSPSALTKADSPQAVGYERFYPDYQNGNFRLPDQFDLDLIFDQPGPIFFRAYAKIGEDHYWTSEKEIYVR